MCFLSVLHSSPKNPYTLATLPKPPILCCNSRDMFVTTREMEYNDARILAWLCSRSLHHRFQPPSPKQPGKESQVQDTELGHGVGTLLSKNLANHLGVQNQTKLILQYSRKAGHKIDDFAVGNERGCRYCSKLQERSIAVAKEHVRALAYLENNVFCKHTGMSVSLSMTTMILLWAAPEADTGGRQEAQEGGVWEPGQDQKMSDTNSFRVFIEEAPIAKDSQAKEAKFKIHNSVMEWLTPMGCDIPPFENLVIHFGPFLPLSSTKAAMMQVTHSTRCQTGTSDATKN
ncbi:hypothetical protein KCV07_g1862, partial [Aureobasidium melanogenum]